jgi:hypothetical protein
MWLAIPTYLPVVGVVCRRCASEQLAQLRVRPAILVRVRREQVRRIVWKSGSLGTYGCKSNRGMKRAIPLDLFIDLVYKQVDGPSCNTPLITYIYAPPIYLAKFTNTRSSI